MEEEVKSVEVDWEMVEDSQVNETAVEVMSTAFSLPASGKPTAAVAPIRRSKNLSIAMVEDNG